MQMRSWFGSAQSAAVEPSCLPEGRPPEGTRLHSGLRLARVAACTAFLVVGAWPALAAGRHAAIVVDANTGQVLHEEAADEARYPASLTKMMTLYMVFEQLEAGRIKPDSRITISPEAAGTSPSKLGLPAGQSIAVADAVKALITKSANDIAVAVAEHLAGDEGKFAAQMTAKARALGMTATTFKNAHGLPDAGQRTTARDMITLGLRLYDHFPQQARLFSLRSFTYAGRTHRNHNTMLDNFPGLEGMKTGYTTASGYNLVAAVRRDGRHVIAAVFGGTTAAARNARMRLILTRSLPRASPEKTRKPNLVAGRVPVPRLARPPAREVAAKPLARPVERTGEEPTRQAASEAPSDKWPTRVRLAATSGDATTMASLVPPRPSMPPPRNDALVARAPSSLQAQASTLGLPSPTPTRGQARAESGPSATRLTDGVQIQIGAFPAEAEARQKLDQVRQRSPQFLGRAGMATPSITVSGRRLYRARFTGFDAASAAHACSELRRQQIDCLVARAE